MSIEVKITKPLAKQTKAELVETCNTRQSIIASRNMELIDVRTQLAHAHSEIARNEATLEARGAEIDALREELRNKSDALDALSVKFIEVQDTLTAIQNDSSVIKNRAELMQVMRKLAGEGIPCIMRGNYLYHGVTKAIIAQIGA